MIDGSTCLQGSIFSEVSKLKGIKRHGEGFIDGGGGEAQGFYVESSWVKVEVEA